MLEGTEKTPLTQLGEFGLIEHLAKNIHLKNKSSLYGIGDDAAVIRRDKDSYTLITCDLLIENIHFNPVYCPMKHLGYKAAVVNFSDIFAMNGKPEQMIVGIAVSSKYTVEAIEELYSGMLLACEKYGVDIVGGDTTSSPGGMQISVSVVGTVAEKDIVYRKGAKPNDLICVTGDLGAAYAGLLVLQREEKTFLANPNYKPEIDEYHYVIEKQLKPEAQKWLTEELRKSGILPTSMIDISDGLASELFHISKQSNTGFRIYESKIPLEQQTLEVADEFSISPVTFAMNGGEDYELLFTAPVDKHAILSNIQGISVIGHITEPNMGRAMVLNSGQEIEVKAQGWNAFPG